jgi:aldose 1-epimerase
MERHFGAVFLCADGGYLTAMPITQSLFGTLPDGRPVHKYSLTGNGGMIVDIINFGGHIQRWRTPDRAGNLGDITLGFDRLEDYLGDHPFFGTTVGRFANRIARGRFTLDGVEYRLPTNAGRNTLHGGPGGFHTKLWNAAQTTEAGNPALKLTYTSPAGEEGFPATLLAEVTFTVTPDNTLRITFHATADGPTVVNLTNHAYFDLAGPASGKTLDHVLQLWADEYAITDLELIPTGEIGSVKGSPLDFTTPTTIGSRIGQLAIGYDNSYVIRDGGKGSLARAARLHHPLTGRTLETWTTQPSVQLYSAGNLDGTIRGIGGTYNRFAGICLETQHLPDAPNHPNFGSTVLRPSQTYHHVVEYRLSI